MTPTISAHVYLNGPHDYNQHPLAPLGCAVQMHKKLGRRISWDPHSVNRWYVGTSTEHYRCFKIFHKETRAERISGTVFFKHRYLIMPKITKADAIVEVEKLTPVPASIMVALTKLSSIFEEAAKRSNDSKLL